MSAKPLVTVLLPAYNHERYVEQSIRSVIAQDYDNVELIVLNDGSKDRTSDVIRSLDSECQARFVRYEFVDKANEGVARTLNRGLAWGQGEFVTGVASDDLMKPNKISALVSAMVDAPTDVGMAGGDADFIDDDGKQIDLGKEKEPVAPGEGAATFLEFYTRDRDDIDLEKNFFSYDTLIRRNYVPGGAMAWRRSALLQVGGWTPGIVIEDWDIWLRLARRYRCVFVPQVLATYRWHASNTVKTESVQLRMGMDHIYQREFPYVRGNRDLARDVARAWLKNSRRLSRAGHRRYMLRYLRPDVWFAVAGLAPSGMLRG